MSQTGITSPKGQYVLHYDVYSICSSMVRYTYQFRGRPQTPASAIEWDENFVDIRTWGQMEEKYLLEVNPKGQVPALTSTKLSASIADSLDITYFLCEHYPQLAPEPHKETIWGLLKDLHAIQFLSVSMKPEHNRAGNITAAIEDRLALPGISDTYRKALEYKMQYHEVTLVHALEPEPIKLAERQTRDFFECVCRQRALHAQNGDLWIFGNEPTALDAQMVVFVARLIDANRRDLIPAEALDIGQRAMELPEWHAVMQGRRTLPYLTGKTKDVTPKKDQFTVTQTGPNGVMV